VPNKLSSKQFSDFRNIPAELANAPQWIPWYWRRHGDKLQKSPIAKYTGDHRRANCRALGEWLGKGNVRDGFSRILNADEHFIVIDLDHGRDAKTGTVEPWARAIVDALDTYTEISYSGSGLHLVCRGGPLSSDWSPNPKDPARGGAPQIEIYSGVTPNKLMSFTGNIFENHRVINERQTAATALLLRRHPH
jgi:putative DNA primase/helicase